MLYSHSSTFNNFTQGQTILLLMYCMFVESGLLESACGSMPEGTSHNNRTVKACSNPMPKPEAASKRNSSAMSDGVGQVVAALTEKNEQESSKIHKQQEATKLLIMRVQVNDMLTS